MIQNEYYNTESILDFHKKCEDKKQLSRNFKINSLLDIKDIVESDIDRFILNFGYLIHLRKLPASNYFYLENGNSHLKSGSIIVQTYTFENYQQLHDFVLDKINNHHFFLYIYYINPEDNTHILRAHFLDKKINLYV